MAFVPHVLGARLSQLPDENLWGYRVSGLINRRGVSCSVQSAKSAYSFRVYGPVMRHLVNFLQSIQLLFNVGIIIVANGQALSQVSKFKLCYAVCCLIFALVGFLIGQVRTLQKYGWFANAAVCPPPPIPPVPSFEANARRSG